MRVKPDNHVGRTLETIQEARDDICSEWFYWSYRAVYDEDPAGVIRLLKKIWREIDEDPSRSAYYCHKFNKNHGREGQRMSQLGLRNPKNAQMSHQRERNEKGEWL
jgi:hypothetical protein